MKTQQFKIRNRTRKYLFRNANQMLLVCRHVQFCLRYNKIIISGLKYLSVLRCPLVSSNGLTFLLDDAEPRTVWVLKWTTCNKVLYFKFGSKQSERGFHLLTHFNVSCSLWKALQQAKSYNPRITRLINLVNIILPMC